ncbi:tetratricopeptide repeat-containing sensor histidine kinase [Thalassotalea sediminis]|uniref:tetratricopeptide repeat-containing sensor histidine kinase n=1 Tax=Thalassotalea sediminis TaxID=1759089 RepID=UPI002573C610|nr:tetratricopeptide repeat-containing sensor histidine kinase [Thalassotalea sediminis]
MKWTIYMCLFLHISTFVFASTSDPLSEEEYKALRSDILDNYSQSPLEAVKRTKYYLARYSQSLTLRQTLRLRYTTVFFLIAASEFEQAFTELAICKSLADQLDEPMLTSYYYSYLAGMLEKLENFDLSLETYSAGLKVASKADNPNMIARMNNNIGHVLIRLGKFEAARPYIEHFLAFAQAHDNQSYMSTAYNNLGEVELGIGNTDSAEAYFRKSLNMREDNDERLNAAWSYYNLAKLALLSNQLSAAVVHLQQTIKIFVEYDRVIEALAPKITLADTLFKLENSEEAKQLTLSTIKIAEQFDNYQILSKAYLLLKSHYFEAENFKQAAIMADAYIKNKEAFMHRQSNQALMHYIAKIDLTAKELQNEQLRKQNIVANQQAKATAYQLYLVITFSTLIIVIIYVFMRFLTRKNKTLSTTVEQLKRTQSELIESGKVSAITTLVSGMAHQLNTPLGIIVTANSVLKERLMLLDDKLNEKSLNLNALKEFISNAKNSLALSESSSDKATQLIQQFKLISAELKDVKSSSVTLKPFLNEKTKIMGQFFECPITIVVEGGDVTVQTYPDVLIEVIEQLLKNSVEHQQKNNPTLHCSFNVHLLPDSVEIIYQDNGVGISDADRNKIFNPFFTTKNMSNSLGLGLNIAYSSVTQLLQGKLTCEPSDDGAKFVLRLPLSIA